MKLSINNFFLKLFFILYSSWCFSSGYQQVIDKYTQAMQTLIKLHTKKFPHVAIELTDSSLPFIAYKKVVTPYAMYINGYAGIAYNNFLEHQDYLKSLTKTQQVLQQYLSKIDVVAGYFPSDNKNELVEAFYELIGSDTVDNMFHIIQTLSNQATTNSYDLQAAFIAYQIAHQIYQKNMKILSVGQGLDFTTSMVENMKNLYSNTLMQLESKLSIGNFGIDKIEDIYAQIKSYNQYLAQVYTDIGDTQKSTMYQDRVTQAAQQYKYYQQAEKTYISLQKSLTTIGKAVALDVNKVSDTVNDLNSLNKLLDQNVALAQKVQDNYQQAKDIFGVGEISNILQQITINLWISNALAQLWLLYLNDQSDHALYTAPSIATFISAGNQNSANPVTNQQVAQAFQDLAALVSQESNSISALSTNTNLASYSIEQLMKAIQASYLRLEQTGKKISLKNNYLLVSMVSITESIKILFYLQQLASSLANVMQQTDSEEISIAVAYVYQYSKQLDAIYNSLKSTELRQIKALIPYFPAQISSAGFTNPQVASWVNWTEQIMLASGVINSSNLITAKQQKVIINHPQVGQKPVSASQLSSAMEQAHKDALTLNFAKASSGYYNLYQLYSNLYELNPTNNEYIQKMQLMKTMYTATSFAAQIQEQGKEQSWQAIKNIPNQYQIAQYQFTNISMSDFGTSELPASLMSVSAGTEYSSLTQQQQADCIKILKAYMVSELIAVQGYNFTDIFNDYTLTENVNVDPSDLATVQQLVTAVEIACNNFTGCSVSSLTLSDASTIQVMVCNNLVIPRVKPLFSSMATALTFFSSAELLFAPSAKAIQLGGSSYVSGNDQKLANSMLEEMVFAYLSAGLVHWNEAKALMNNISATLPKEKTGTQVLPKDFTANLNQVNSYITRAQSMLFASDQSAYAYSLQLKNQSLTANVREILFSTYQEFITWMTEKCLIGTPYQSSYRNLIGIISNTYVDWSSWLDPQKNAAQISQNTADSIALIQKAGDACMDTSYIQSLYSGYTQQHYAAAASYYQSARQEYLKNSDATNAAAMEVKILDAYFKGVNQSVDMFLNYVLTQGVTYTHEQTNQQQQISFAQLMQDSQSGFSSNGEQNAYNSVKDLLLNAGKGLTLLIKKVVPAKSASTNKKQKISSKAESGLSKNVVTYLRSKNIMGSNDEQPLYFNAGVARKVYATNMDAYSKFKANSTDLASWLNVLYSALQAIYAFHYLGATPGETEQLMQTQIQGFFTALQASAVATENNAFAYGE